MRNRLKITYPLGTRFERLVIVGEGKKHLAAGYSTFAYLCRCDCGVEKLVLPGNLRRGDQKSCGCFNRERVRAAKTIHGHRAAGRGGKIYNAWLSMRERCTNTKRKHYNRYGGRGITICEAWEDFSSFLHDMGDPPMYIRDFSVGRKNNDLGYTPENCRWETATEQGRNKAPEFHRYVTAFGETRVASAWLDDPRCRATKNALFQRLNRGIAPEMAITTPVRPRVRSNGHSRPSVVSK